MANQVSNECSVKQTDSCLGVPLKWVSLFLMVSQMVGMVMILRVSRTQHVDGPRYLNTTAILFSEVIKFSVSLVLHWWTSPSLRQCLEDLRTHSYANPVELFKTCIPSLLYTVQNNLLFVGISHLSAASYQVTYQLKIITTAGLSVIILGTKLSMDKWISLVVLTIGVAFVNTSGDKAATAVSEEASRSTFIGLAAVISACFTSGLAGVYLEKILKQAKTTIWLRNIQLGFSGALFALVIALQTDGAKIRQNGFTQGYSPLVCVVVICQAVGGLIVAAVMKYADNILKCFGCAIAIIFTCILSAEELHEFTPDARFVAGTCLVLLATAIYSIGLPGLPEKDVLLPLFNKMEKTAMTGEKSAV